MPFTLSLNTNPLVNRFADPDDLIDTVARDIRIRDLQLTHEFINPSWPAPVIRRLTRQMGAALQRTGVRVTSGMTGPYGRLNHFGHPAPEVLARYEARGAAWRESPSCGEMRWHSGAPDEVRCHRDAARRYWQWRAPIQRSGAPDETDDSEAQVTGSGEEAR